ncbi:FAD-dependent oxidoreductase [Candidatus Halocynthiibacter alkanivorans]|uniref:FAD-dependent oxidoreductase n=1 Tax=Candidatus Halocynthiibacter alkanivorans TaxID=2267619 RepID=UPI000DF1398A|nr:FAD-dependent oxidoreductase [Candidatus Halocynthiibacter alkanivorans]
MNTTSVRDLDGLHLDVAIIGGGINGASAAQHFSAAGYRVLVVDQGDFADGASSRSSRLLHCGLRHLATGANFWSSLLHPDRLLRSMGTVRADMVARDEIVRSIPGRVKAMNFCLPIYEDDQYAPWHMDAAFSALRLMSPAGVPLEYRRYHPDKLDQVPVASWLRDRGKLRSVAVFREYLFDWPERIALDALFDAQRMGALVHNYTRVEKLERVAPEGHWHLALRATGGAGAVAGETAQVTAGIVLNLTGAWVDDVIGATGQNARPKCTGMKGIHIAVRLPDAFAGWGVFAYNSIGEPLYCLPWRGFHYIGLTRTPFDGELASVIASDQEIDWLIAESNRCLPRLALSRSDILYTWAGVNPLTHDAGDPMGSREIKIHGPGADGPSGIFTLTGGAIMTHRRVAGRLLRKVSKQIAPSGAAQKLRFDPDPGDIGSDGARLIAGEHSVSVAEVLRCARDEQPATLSDLIMRRLGLGWDNDQGLALARPVAEVAAPVLQWSDARIEAEVSAFEAHLQAARRRPGVP